MKRIKFICVGLLLFVINFIGNWYSDNIVSDLGVFIYLVIKFVIMLGIVFYLIKLMRCQKSKVYLLALIPFMLVYFGDFRLIRAKYEFKKYENERNIIIEEIKNSDYNKENIKLDKYQYLSSDKSIYVYQNNDGQVICFWIYRGYESSVELIYSSQGEKLIFENIDKERIIKIVKLEENWFYIEKN